MSKEAAAPLDFYYVMCQNTFMEKLPELLAPAGSLNKLKTAFYFGADAVYAGGKNFSLRSYADNFTDEELAEGAAYAHRLNKKLYVAVNIFAKNADFAQARDYFRFLFDIGTDAVLITDPGLLSLCKEVAPRLPIHLSTQANTLNKYAVSFWEKQGVSRVVLARELSLEDIKEIAAFSKAELEIFVHGAMCVSYSGRCLLSNYLTSRDANRGECVQACRWKYRLDDVSDYPHPPLYAEEDARGTYLLNSRDLNLLSDIPALMNAGVASLKIEGRMKSEYYVATVVNAYRRALDEYAKTGNIGCEKYEDELKKITHRAYTKAYLWGDNDKTILYEGEQSIGTRTFCAYVEDYEEGMAKVEMRNRFRIGDELEILSPTDSFNKTFTVTKIIDEEGTEIDDAKLVQQKLRIAIPCPVAPGDILRKKL